MYLVAFCHVDYGTSITIDMINDLVTSGEEPRFQKWEKALDFVYSDDSFESPLGQIASSGTIVS